MKRKLLLLNLALAALIAGAAWRLRLEWKAGRQHENAVLRQKLKPSPAPPYSPLPAAQPVVPATYLDIAQKMLFSRDRNSTVVVETAPPPPPKPMPPLPVLHGIMNIGDGPTAIMSEKKDAPNREVRPGQEIGEFKLLALSTGEIVLEWDGKEVRRRLDELLDRSVPAQAAAAAQPPAVGNAQPATPKIQVNAPAGPGTDIGNGVKACVAGDSSPPGTVVDGMKKSVFNTPFGQGCRWDPVK